MSDPSPDSVPPMDPGPQERRLLWAEIGVVVGVCVVPHLAGAIVGLLDPVLEHDNGVLAHLQLAAYSVPSIAVTWWMMSRSGRPWREFGVVRPHVPTEVLIAALLAALCWGASYAAAILVTGVYMVLPGAWDLISIIPATPAEEYARPVGGAATATMVAATLVSALGEEMVLRAYLIPRLRTVLGTAWGAVLLSSLLGASYHIYHGSYGMLLVFVVELLMGALFLRVPRLWAFALGHAVYDLALVFWLSEGW